MVRTGNKVSIVLPVFNGAKFLKRSIESALNQTYANIELIIVDDCSTDATPGIIASFSDPRIRVIRHQRNRGLPASLNTGFSKATGEFLTWTSDDNYFSLNALERELVFLKENACSFVYCDYYRFTDEKPETTRIIKLPDVVDLSTSNDIGPCFLYTRKVKQEIGEYSVDAELAEDYDYWFRISKKFKMMHFSEPLYYYTDHKNSLTSTRFQEVRVAEVLAKIKNGVDCERVLSSFVNQCIEKYPNFFLMRKVALAFHTRETRKILTDFKIGNTNFSKANLALKQILIPPKNLTYWSFVAPRKLTKIVGFILLQVSSLRSTLRFQRVYT